MLWNSCYQTRADGDEVEMILTAPTTSWLGLGWRPSSTTKSCFKFPKQYSQYRPADFHAMDCMDMVIGVAREGLGRVGDFYTRDRSTPREDTFWESIVSCLMIFLSLFYHRVGKMTL